MVEVCAVFCYCLLWLDADRQYMYLYTHGVFMSIVTVGMFVV